MCRLALVLTGLIALVACSSSNGHHASAGTTSTITPTATATVTATGTPSSGSTAPSTVLCAPSTTHSHYYGGEGAAGTEYSTFVITNISKKPCRTGAYPGFALLRDNGKPLPTSVRRDPNRAPVARPGPKFFTVAPGKDFYAEVYYSFTEPDCGENSPPSASRVRLTLPDNRDYAVVPLQDSEIDACDGILHAFPVFHHTKH